MMGGITDILKLVYILACLPLYLISMFFSVAKSVVMAGWRDGGR